MIGEREQNKLKEIVVKTLPEEFRGDGIRFITEYLERFQKGNKKVCILGTAKEAMRDIPFEQEVTKGGDWEIWGLSERPDTLPAFSRWYELHNLERKRRKSPAYWEQLKTMGPKLWVASEHPELPEANVFPKEQIMDAYGQYFTNTVSWLTAHAMLQNYTTIGIWGVTMATRGEYGHQRPSCEYFLGRLEGMGCRLILPEESDLLKTRRLYGFDDVGDRMSVRNANRLADLKERASQQSAAHENAKTQCMMLVGELQCLQKLAAADGELNSDLIMARLDECGTQATQAQQQEREIKSKVDQLHGAIENMDWVAQGF